MCGEEKTQLGLAVQSALASQPEHAHFCKALRAALGDTAAQRHLGLECASDPRLLRELHCSAEQRAAVISEARCCVLRDAGSRHSGWTRESSATRSARSTRAT